MPECAARTSKPRKRSPACKQIGDVLFVLDDQQPLTSAGPVIVVVLTDLRVDGKGAHRCPRCRLVTSTSRISHPELRRLVTMSPLGWAARRSLRLHKET